MSYKVLLIDSDPDKLEAIRRPLKETGYQVVIGTDGPEVVSEFERVEPDLVVVDACRSDRDGFAICRELKSLPAGKTTPVLVLHEATGDDLADDAARSDCGCDELAERPIADDELIGICERLIGIAGVRDPANAATAGTSVDTPDLDGALDSLDSIMESGPSAAEDDIVEASARGDFSGLMSEWGGETEIDRPAPDESSASQPGAPVAPPFDPIVEGADPSGADIEDRLDDIFSSGLPSTETRTDENATPATSPPEADAAGGPDPAKTPPAVETQTAALADASAPLERDQPLEASPPEPPAQTSALIEEPSALDSIVETQTVGLSEEFEPPDVEGHALPSIAQPKEESQTAPVLPAGKATKATATQPARRKIWPIAAMVLVAVVGGAAALLFLGRGGKASTTGADGGVVADGRTATQFVPPAPAVPAVSILDNGSLIDMQGIEPIVADEPSSLPAAPGTATATPEVAAPRPKAVKPAPTAVRPKPKPAAPTPKATPPEPKPVAPTPKATPPKPAAPTPTATRPAPKPEPVAAVESAETNTTETPPEPSPTAIVAPEPASTTPGEPVAEPAPAPVIPSTPPFAIARIAPSFPPRALRRAASSSVDLRVLVSAEGRVLRVVVKDGTDPGSELVAAAIDAVLRTKYEPATENGRPVKGWVEESFLLKP